MRISDWSSDVCSSDLPELDLPVALLRGAGDLDVVVRTLDGAVRLQEHDRLLRDRGTGLRGVVGVVQADTDDLADAADAGADARVAVDLGQARRVDALQLVETAGKRGRVDVGDHARKVADRAGCVQDARLFLPARAIAQQLHDVSP